MRHRINYHETSYGTHGLVASLLKYALLLWLDYCHRGNKKNEKYEKYKLKSMHRYFFKGRQTL